MRLLGDTTSTVLACLAWSLCPLVSAQAGPGVEPAFAMASIHLLPEAAAWARGEVKTPGSCALCHGEDEPTTAPDGAAYPMFDESGGGDSHGAPDVDSATCLSCHDGVLAPGAMEWGAHVRGALYRNGLDDTEHPVSVAVDADGRRDLHTPAEIEQRGVPLFGAQGNQVECRSCHTAHGSTRAMLRVDGTELCLVCHAK